MLTKNTRAFVNRRVEELYEGKTKSILPMDNFISNIVKPNPISDSFKEPMINLMNIECKK